MTNHEFLHTNRRTLLKAAGLTGMAWLTPVAEMLARDEEKKPSGAPAKSVIVLWMQGGPSQLETFDPHPESKTGGGVKAIRTAAPGIRLAKGFEQLADQMESVSLVRSLTSKEGDHQRAAYNMKTGFRPDPTAVHPSLGAIICHHLQDNVEIPRHISILPGPWPARGGYLGDQYDAFKTGDPRGPIPDVKPQVSQSRFDRRIKDLDVVEQEFARGRLKNLDRERTLHGISIRRALKMMSSAQLKAFDVNTAPESLLAQYGDTPFGRGCLAAVQLIETGVRCVEVTLTGWDSHLNNHETQGERAAILDPAFAALIRDLKRRKLLDQTLVLCGGEFGRTPWLNGGGGRDHWPHGFSVALAGGGIAGGRVIGETSPDPIRDEKRRGSDVIERHNVADLHATILHALGINYGQLVQTPIGRTLNISEGNAIEHLLDA